jgi:acyl-CoA synthetase (AMP-forming)/AMP-acid ligase II/aryl carrier-like protein
MPRFDTLHHLLAANARDDRQITLIEGENEQRLLSFRQLQRRALGQLGALQRRGLKPGDAMILFLADNERFIETFWACVLGGIVPVPLAPGVTDEHRRKLMRVAEQFESAHLAVDAQAFDRIEASSVVLESAAVWERLRSRVVLSGTLDVDGAPGAIVPAGADDLAFIQFSSGSTGSPKGVRLTHGNLTANIDAIGRAGASTDRDVALSWMPLSHDMGLIGFHLSMVGDGISHAIMRTDLFARRPLLWLEEASRRRATLLCSPNFGFQHTLRQFERRAPAGLDLSAVRLLYNGAEPISAEICRRFSSAMAPFGLKPGAMFPVYGLAEASVAVAFPLPGAPIASLLLDRSSLNVGEAVRPVPADTLEALEFVTVGTAVPHCEIRIAGAADEPLADRFVGHVQIRGANVTRGYQGAATPPLPDGAWLDTGDLGLFADGQLVITGRAKDIVIVNGQNVYPHDIERLAERADPALAGRVAAAGIRLPGADTEGLAIFVQHRTEIAGFVPLAITLKRTVAQQAGLEVACVVPVARIPRTTSGKVQRHALAQAFERGEFDAALAELAPLLAADVAAEGAEDGPVPVVARLVALCAPLVTTAEITPQTNLLEINLNSLTLARMHEAIEREFPHRIEVTDFFDHPTLQELAALLESPAA